VSAGLVLLAQTLPPVERRLSVLAPLMQARVELAIADANAASLDAVVYESRRSHELAVGYYARGRTVIPPQKTVTNAPDETYSWHGFCLAVDVISRAKGWDKPDAWFAAVAVHFKRHGLKWGGDWKQHDLPHFQFDTCKPSPSARARELLKTQGIEAVWRAVGAIGPVNDRRIAA
jgi:hypothetical protein